MKRGLVLGLLLLVLLIPSVVMAAFYSAPITVTESDDNSYTQLPVSVSVSNSYLADSYFIDSTGLDTRLLLGSTELRHMLASDRVTFVADITASSQHNFSYTTGNSLLDDFPIIVGHNGYVTITDVLALEPTNDFTLEANGYYGIATSGSSISKEDAVVIYADGAGNIVGAILGADAPASPTGFVDPDGAWTDEALVYDDDTGPDAECLVPAASWGSFLEVTRAATVCKGVRFHADYDVGEIEQINLDAYYNGAWHDVYEGIFANNAWVEKNFVDNAVYNVTAIRAKFYNANAGAITALWNEADLLALTEDLSVTAAIATSGEYDVILDADAGGNTLKLYLGATEEDSAVLGANSVPNTGGHWYMLSDGTPYLNSYEHSVAGTLIAWFQPITMIIDTTLPDREGTAQDGTITWGSDPTGVTTSIGALLPESSAVAEARAATDVPSFVPSTEGVDSFTVPGVEGEGFLLYDMFKELLGQWAVLGGPNISMPYFWKTVAVIFGWTFGTVIMLLTRNIFFGIIAYFIGFAVPAGAMGGVLDLWVPIVFCLGAIGIGLLTAKWGASSM